MRTAVGYETASVEVVSRQDDQKLAFSDDGKAIDTGSGTLQLQFAVATAALQNSRFVEFSTTR
jgi:hypothetical protein